MGSNAIRMVVAEVPPSGEIEILERAEQAVRLGQDTFASGRIHQDTINTVRGIMRDFKQVLDSYQVKHVRAVATSSVREATNADVLLDRILMATNLDVEVIDLAEESRLTVSAVRHLAEDLLGPNSGKALIVEVGGGNALLTILDSGQIIASESYNLGSIRLQEILATFNEPPHRSADLLRNFISGTVNIMKRSMPLDEVTTVVAVVGDSPFVARDVGEPMNDDELFRVNIDRFENVVQESSTHNVDELAEMFSLQYDQAEKLVPTLLTYQALLHATRAQQLFVAQISMREGLLLDLARMVRGEEDEELFRSIIQSAEVIGEKYNYDAKHTHWVAELSGRLFDELQREHGLTRWERLLLYIAALLHDIGKFVSNRAHHKHTYYLIANSEIFGLQHSSLQMIALVARYHRRSPPTVRHPEYMALQREQRMMVNKLAAILRVADALDRSNTQQVGDFDLQRVGDELVLYVYGGADLTLERHALDAKSDLFVDAYGMHIRLEEASSPRMDV